MLTILAHGGEVHELATGEVSLIKALTHQPTWLALFIIVFFLFGVYALLEKVKVKPLSRVMVLLPMAILIAIVYLSHNPAVATVVLVAGFLTAFFLAFTQMKNQKPAKEPQQPPAPKN